MIFEKRIKAFIETQVQKSFGESERKLRSEVLELQDLLSQMMNKRVGVKIDKISGRYEEVVKSMDNALEKVREGCSTFERVNREKIDFMIDDNRTHTSTIEGWLKIFMENSGVNTKRIDESKSSNEETMLRVRIASLLIDNQVLEEERKELKRDINDTKGS